MESIKDIIKNTIKNLKPHEQRGLEELQKKISFEQKKLSKWEMIVMKKLMRTKITFEKKFRKFPLEIDDKIIYYSPDFVLDFPYKKRLHVLIEVHEELKEDDVKKFRAFLDVYGRVYWLIVVTKDEEIHKWNKFDSDKESLFHDIWTLDGIDELIFTLERLRLVSKQNQKNEIAECPRCKKHAEGRFEIDFLFGYRYEGKIPQSYCKICRNKKKDVNLIIEQFEKPKHVFCPGCGLEFLERIRGQSFCDECLRKYFN